MGEDEWISMAQTGDLDAFNHLVLAYQDLIYHHARSILGESDSSEDATQETFIKAFRGLPHYRGGSFRAWLLRIATNTCYDELRRSKDHYLVDDWLVNQDGEEYDLLEIIPSPEPPLDDQVVQGELDAAIQRGLNRLPVEYRAAAVIVDILGFNYAEAAESLGVPVGTVKSRLARARRGLRQYLLQDLEPVH